MANTKDCVQFKKSDFGKLRGLISNGSLYNDVCISSDINEAWLKWDERLNDMVNNSMVNMVKIVQHPHGLMEMSDIFITVKELLGLQRDIVKHIFLVQIQTVT